LEINLDKLTVLSTGDQCTFFNEEKSAKIIKEISGFILGPIDPELCFVKTRPLNITKGIPSGKKD
jgi:hypothetical protein